MPQRKSADEGKSQKRKFIDAAREIGADVDGEKFRRALRKVATAAKPKKPAQKPKD